VPHKTNENNGSETAKIAKINIFDENIDFFLVII